MQVSNLKSPFKSDAIGSMTVTPNSDPEGYKHKPAYHGKAIFVSLCVCVCVCVWVGVTNN